MKDVYSPLEIDEQWDQRAPMIEGDTATQAVTSAPDAAVGVAESAPEGAVATMGERPAGEPDPTLGVDTTYGATPAEVSPQAADQPENAYGTPQTAQMVPTPAPEGQMEPVAVDDGQALAQLGDSAAVEDSGNSQVPVGIPHITPEPPAGIQMGAQPELAESAADTTGAQPAEAVDKTIVEPVAQFEPAEPRNQGGDDEPTEPSIDPAKLDRNIKDAEAALPKPGDELETSPVKTDKDKEPHHTKGKEAKPDQKRARAIEYHDKILGELKADIKRIDSELAKEKANMEAVQRKISDLEAKRAFKEDEVDAFERAKAALAEMLEYNSEEFEDTL